MIGDAIIQVTCDHQPPCDNSIEITPEYVFNDYSGKSGHYDTSKRSLRKLIEKEDWFLAEDNATTYCDWHRPQEDDDDQ